MSEEGSVTLDSLEVTSLAKFLDENFATWDKWCEEHALTFSDADYEGNFASDLLEKLEEHDADLERFITS
jgi:hypothetical protein